MSAEVEYDLRGTAARRILHAWWWRLVVEDGPDRPPRRGERAELRRCHRLAQVAMDKAFNDLLRALRRNGVQLERGVHGLAAAARVLMEVRGDAQEPNLARLMAQARTDKNPRQGAVSGLRFRRLLAIDDLEELTQALIRAVRLCGEKAPVASLAADIFDWADPDRREKVRQRWAYDYYANAPDAGEDKAA